MTKQPIRNHISEGTRLLKVTVDPAWRHGDLVSVSVPAPYDQNIKGLPEHRNLYVEVPEGKITYFYVKYYEDEDTGSPVLVEGEDGIDSEQYPLLAAPIIVPNEAVLLPRSRGFIHWGLLWEAVLPVSLYAGLLCLVHYLITDRHTLWIIIAYHAPVVLMSMGFIFLRYRKSILFEELVWQTIFSTVCMFVFIFGLWLVFDWIPESRTLSSIKTAVIAPITEEIFKFLLVRLIAYRGFVCDGQAIIAYACMVGVMFAVVENVLYCNRANIGQEVIINGVARTLVQNGEKRLFGYLVRVAGFVSHPSLVVISAARFAQGRFLGVKRNFFSCIYISILLHAAWNGTCVVSEYVTTQDNARLVAYIMFGILGVIMVTEACILRYFIVKIENIPAIDIRKLIDDGQLSRRSICMMMEDSLCCCCSAYKGIFSSSRREDRPIVLKEDLTDAQKSQISVSTTNNHKIKKRKKEKKKNSLTRAEKNEVRKSILDDPVISVPQSPWSDSQRIPESEYHGTIQRQAFQPHAGYW